MFSFAMNSVLTMKITLRSLLYIFGAMLLLSCLDQRCHAKARDMDSGEPGAKDNTDTVTDPGEEARKIRRLVKLALYPNASEPVKKALADEIASVEKSKKFREDVAQHLLQGADADTDPTLPKVMRVSYKDGSLRGVLFIQADADKTAKPAELAWALDSKREKKEHGDR